MKDTISIIILIIIIIALSGIIYKLDHTNDMINNNIINDEELYINKETGYFY